MAPDDSDRGRPRAHLFSSQLTQTITISDYLDEQEHATVLRRQRSLRYTVSTRSVYREPPWILPTVHRAGRALIPCVSGSGGRAAWLACGPSWRLLAG